MSVKIIKDDKENFVFKLTNSDVWITNLLRRTVIGQVSAFAIDSITVYENSSYMFDEYLAHRIGLLPMKTPKKSKHGEEVAVMLDVQGPKKVVSGDIKSKSKDVRVVYDNIPIIDLNTGQSLRFEGIARMGVPRMHQKFQAGLAMYNYDDPKEIMFTVESYGNYPMAHDLVKVAFQNIKMKIKEFHKKLDKV